MAATNIKSVFDAGPEVLQDICDRIEAGESMASVARRYKVHRAQLTRWAKADPERERQIDAARKLSAEAYADKAEQVIKGARDKFALDKARELAHHYRWCAKVRHPDRFADRVKQDVEMRAKVRVRDLTGRKAEGKE